jgi:hypothetical protein
LIRSTFPLFALTAAFLHAGTIQGVVLEQASGRPLARTIVRLDPVPKSGGEQAQPLITRAGRSGHFVFPVVAPGLYLLIALRDGYFPAACGQKLPTGRGRPVEVTADSDLFAELRLRHKGAITGRVLDENGVGALGVSVVAYHARLPLRSAGRGESDDRGVYRIPGLDPGKYWVRSAAHTLDDGSGWLPTFGPEAREIRDARTLRVTVDADTADGDISPEPGRLFHLAGTIACDTKGAVIVVVSSETGRRRAQAARNNVYRFDGLAPGADEVFAALPDGSASGFIELFLDHDSDAGNVQVMQLPSVDIEVRGANGAALDTPVTLIGRRQDLSESEPAREIKGPRAILAPGHWEFRARVRPGKYVESISGSYALRRPWRPERPSDWFDVFIEPRFATRIRITVSDRSGRIAGRVIAGAKPAPGAPVFLWPVADTARRSLGGPLQVVSDTEGRFHFDSLPPGDDRALASFDIPEIDEELLELSQAITVHAAASETATVDLGVWSPP